MKKYIIPLNSLVLGLNISALGATPTFSVSSPVVQNMVPNSTQNLTYVLSTTTANTVTIHCAFSSSSPNLSGNFNNNGCVSSGGVGINSSLSDTVNLTLTTNSSASGTITGTLTFTQTNGRGSPPQVFTLPITIPSVTNRTVTFKNYCPFNVYFGLSSSSVPAKNKQTIACTTNSDCSAYAYSTCINNFCGGGACRSDSDCVNSHAGTCTVPAGSTTAFCNYCASNSDCIQGAQCDTSNNQCYWTLPAPTDAATKHYVLNPFTGATGPDTDTVTIPDNSSVNGYQLLWGGGFSGRTNCSFTGAKYTCKTADCNINGTGDSQGGCALGEGFNAPSTSAEVTFVSTAPDTYDVTIINGANIPVAMFPSTGSAASPQKYNNPYVCGSPGSNLATVTSVGTVGACNWTFNVPSLGFRWVNNDNATTCSADNTCTSINPNYRCGLTTASITGNSAQTTCGTELGLWNQNEICAINPSYNASSSIVNCTLTNIGGTSNSIINLLACTGKAGTSCFNVSAANSTCCGCTNWQNQGVQVPTNSSIVQQCVFNNTYWGSITSPASGNVLPNLVWLKKGCPSAYVYPFDDKTSTFTCPGNEGQSVVNYTIEFCPGQESGR